jgi:uncharacterized protein
LRCKLNIMSIADIKHQIMGQAPKLRDSGVAHVAVFGSRARGDCKPQSDLDLLLEIREGKSFSLFDLVGVEAILSEATGFSANVFLRRSLDRSFYDSIKQDVLEVF